MRGVDLSGREKIIDQVIDLLIEEMLRAGDAVLFAHLLSRTQHYPIQGCLLWVSFGISRRCLGASSAVPGTQVASPGPNVPLLGPYNTLSIATAVSPALLEVLVNPSASKFNHVITLKSTAGFLESSDSCLDLATQLQSITRIMIS